MNEHISKCEAKFEAGFATLENRMEQWETRNSNLTSYVTKLSNGMSEQQAKASGSVPSNTMIHSKSLNAITLKSGKTDISLALLDLGVAINVIYESSGISALKDTTVVLGLANRTVTHPKGFLKDVLIQVKGLVLPVDFYMLDMTDEIKADSTLILGRTFLRTAQTIINVKDGVITMGFGDQ
ncbi:uncharacterized protein LOC114742397 [Neltuma alba]|uniref:uncharacterized protein LOC114742397 n=1 Tax=Neltuma alba TaxID=207710 RepID=UPI0010A4AE9B|nr:uncharacterized protein LOC114742397 [Prosopis alba]